MRPTLYRVITLTLAIAGLTAGGPALAESHNTHDDSTPGLVRLVRMATERFGDPAAARAAGYGPFLGCVSGPEFGAMGQHYVNGSLVGDNAIDASLPEALIYEPQGGRLQLVGVEFIVPAAAWNATHDAPPVLEGQTFQYVGAPNRYGIDAFYELHVWAWRHNPNGTFADWHPNVDCGR
jgi:hypothetical protein